MTIQTRNLYTGTRASDGGIYKVDEHFDDVTGFITGHTVTVPVGGQLQWTVTNNVTKQVDSHVHSAGTSAPVTAAAGKFAKTIPAISKDPKMGYTFQPLA